MIFRFLDIKATEKQVTFKKPVSTVVPVSADVSMKRREKMSKTTIPTMEDSAPETKRRRKSDTKLSTYIATPVQTLPDAELIAEGDLGNNYFYFYSFFHMVSKIVCLFVCS